jgi:hypothetical protein
MAMKQQIARNPPLTLLYASSHPAVGEFEFID